MSESTSKREKELLREIVLKTRTVMKKLNYGRLIDLNDCNPGEGK